MRWWASLMAASLPLGQHQLQPMGQHQLPWFGFWRLLFLQSSFLRRLAVMVSSGRRCSSRRVAALTSSADVRRLLLVLQLAWPPRAQPERISSRNARRLPAMLVLQPSRIRSRPPRALFCFARSRDSGLAAAAIGAAAARAGSADAYRARRRRRRCSLARRRRLGGARARVLCRRRRLRRRRRCSRRLRRRSPRSCAAAASRGARSRVLGSPPPSASPSAPMLAPASPPLSRSRPTLLCVAQARSLLVARRSTRRPRIQPSVAGLYLVGGSPGSCGSRGCRRSPLAGLGSCSFSAACQGQGGPPCMWPSRA